MYGAADWMELVALVLERPAEKLLQQIRAAPKGSCLTISDPGRPFEAEKEIQVVYSKSSAKVRSNCPHYLWNQQLSCSLSGKPGV